MEFRLRLCPRFLLVGFIGLLALEAITMVAGFDYGEAVDKTLLFFEAQRAGKLPYDNRVKWRTDSGMRDGYSQGVDLVGGYYDAGDHVKFGLPMAFSVTMMAWAAIDFSKDVLAANKMDQTLWAIRWGTDYFLKAHTHPNVLWAQVGDGASDHLCWERAEDMTTSRTAYKLDSSNPGSDLAGETAAALAAASLAFRPYNSSYAQQLVQHAEQLFYFADTFRGLYDDSITNAEKYYTSSGYQDELLWAAVWLYRATNKDRYLEYVVQNAASMGGTGWAVREFSWDNKYAGVQVLVSKLLLEGKGGAYASTLKQYQAKADYFACACVQKNNGFDVQLTPGGLVYVRQWNNMQYASSAAFLLAVYSDYLSQAKAVVNCPEGTAQPQDLFNFAKSQADYILGKNPKSMSYLVGYGTNYPKQVHHRGASIASISVHNAYVGCVQGFEEWYHRTSANPNVVHGGLVGGPDNNDEFDDDRSNYEQTEPTISGTAPLVGLFSKLRSSNTYSTPYARNTPKSSYSTPTTYVKKPQNAPKNPYTTPNVPIRFKHSITGTWNDKGQTVYHHTVLVKNMSMKTVRELKLKIENLSGPIYGLIPTGEKNIFQVPPHLRVLLAGGELDFVYIQGGPQAKVSVYSFH
ncbi:endoglucanase 5 [Spinacia oleracea]|uniref:Endoglucanase n=1 Tax=Spinacia oleracea TaxID=3562 RepID=A0A9R0JZP0_SPIOL|nr:endoglucanase 5 [Spinacia oleracea]